MRLKYFQSSNFGDALNPYIFNHFLPDFFNEDPTIEFYGIGSTLGFIPSAAKIKIILAAGLLMAQVLKLIIRMISFA